MPGPDPRTPSKPKKREAPESPKDPRLEGEKKDPKFKIVETRPEAPIGALGNKKKGPKLKQPGPAGSIDRKQGLGRIIDGKFYPAMAKGGRAMLRGGGICKRGMNRKAVGKNS